MLPEFFIRVQLIVVQLIMALTMEVLVLLMVEFHIIELKILGLIMPMVGLLMEDLIAIVLMIRASRIMVLMV